MSVYKEARLPIRQLESLVFDHKSGEVVIRREVPEQPFEGPRFISVDAWWHGWNGTGMVPLINSGLNTWLNRMGWQSANEEGIAIDVAVTSVVDEARYATELERALKSAKGNHLNAEHILLKVKPEARRIALNKSTKVSFVGGYLLGFVDTLSDVYGLSVRNRERLKSLATFSRLSRP